MLYFHLQSVMNQIRQSLGEIPIVEDELRKASGEEEVTFISHDSFCGTAESIFTY